MIANGQIFPENPGRKLLPQFVHSTSPEKGATEAPNCNCFVSAIYGTTGQCGVQIIAVDSGK